MIKVSWDDKKCIAAGVCVKTLPSVFQMVEGKFVIIPDGAPEDRIRTVVGKCPSGALRIVE